MSLAALTLTGFVDVQKFYKTLSEIMPDVTYVVKTGRQVVERKQVDFPAVLTSQIDAIKQHFNDLGAQVAAIIYHFL